MPKPVNAVMVLMLAMAAAAPPTDAATSLPAMPPPAPMPSTLPPPALSLAAAAQEAAALRRAMARQVSHLITLPTARQALLEDRARAMLAAAHTIIGAPQLVIVVDRAPAAQTLALMAAGPGPEPWTLIGAAHVATGQARRKDYYITPVGVFAHTDAILDFRAQGTFNTHHVRGLGLAGMRVWDFGWQWALKGWHRDGAGGDIRLQMHATDPVLLERRLGRPASEGCVRVSSSMNRFLDLHGVIDADAARVAVADLATRALLGPGRTPTVLAGRLLVVVDSTLPAATPPTQSARPVDWPAPGPPPAASPGSPATPQDRPI